MDVGREMLGMSEGGDGGDVVMVRIWMRSGCCELH